MNWRPGIKHPNKYGAKKTPCAWGHRHDSGDEAAYCNSLHLRQRAADPEAVEILQQQPFILTAHGVIICKIVVDFVTVSESGARTAREVKGVETAAWRIKWKMFCAQYKDLPKVVIKKGIECR